MNSIHLDTLGGISGDMFAAAFLDQKPQLMIGIREAVGKLKLGEGILIETKSGQKGIGVVIGVGMNINESIEEMPEFVKNQAVSLAIHSGKSWQRELILSAILNEFENLYTNYLLHQ